MALIFFMGSDYAPDRIFVAGLDSEILYISRFNMRNNMRFDSACIFCFISTVTYKIVICLTRNLAIVFHDHNVRNPGLSRHNMIFPCMLMSRLGRRFGLYRGLRLGRCFRLGRLCRYFRPGWLNWSLGLSRDFRSFGGFRRLFCLCGLNRLNRLLRLFRLCGFNRFSWFRRLCRFSWLSRFRRLRRFNRFSRF